MCSSNSGQNVKIAPSADVGDYDGVLINVALGLNYKAFEHVGFGLSYNYFELDVNIDKSNWQGNIETIYEGIYVNASFYYRSPRS